MCRKKDLHCCCIVAFGTGLLLGRWMDSWFWCGFGGIGLIMLGVTMLRRR